MKNFKKINKKNYKKGIAIFIAVIAVSSLLLIAMAISDISYKEQVISYSGRDSKVAFYAANSGLECAMFFDLKGGPAGSYRFKTKDGDAEPVGLLQCGSGTTFINDDEIDEDSAVTTFYFNISETVPKSCSVVEVTKVHLTSEIISTTIDAFGYNNICDDGQVGAGNRNLERSFRVTY